MELSITLELHGVADKETPVRVEYKSTILGKKGATIGDFRLCLEDILTNQNQDLVTALLDACELTDEDKVIAYKKKLASENAAVQPNNALVTNANPD